MHVLRVMNSRANSIEVGENVITQIFKSKFYLTCGVLTEG
jgi:hypothetical protein